VTLCLPHLPCVPAFSSQHPVLRRPVPVHRGSGQLRGGMAAAAGPRTRPWFLRRHPLLLRQRDLDVRGPSPTPAHTHSLTSSRTRHNPHLHHHHLSSLAQARAPCSSHPAGGTRSRPCAPANTIAAARHPHSEPPCPRPCLTLATLATVCGHLHTTLSYGSNTRWYIDVLGRLPFQLPRPSDADARWVQVANAQDIYATSVRVPRGTRSTLASDHTRTHTHTGLPPHAHRRLGVR
jgi:hypothetical protein